MKTSVIISTLLMPLLLASCGSFGEGLLMGLGNMGSYGGGSNYYSAPTGGNMNYLLDPNYAIMQVSAKEEQEYQNFSRNFKKSDGSSYSKNEWRALQGQALQEMNSGGSSSSYSGGSSSTSTSSSSPSRQCRKVSSSDMAHCNGTGVCQRCNGNKRYYDTSFGNSRWVDPCTACGGTGKCPSCGGRGTR